VGAWLKTKLSRAPALTVTLALAEVMPVLAAVRVFKPAVFSVMAKEAVPEVREEAVGRVAWVSLELNETGLAKEVAVFPFASRAVRVTLKEVPAVMDEGTEERLKRVAAPGFTVTESLIETGEPEMEAPRVTAPARTPVKVAE